MMMIYQRFTAFAVVLCLVLSIRGAFAQEPICNGPNCPKPTLANAIELTVLQEDLTLDGSNITQAANVDRFSQTILATVRCTVSGVCGSGTIVGRDNDGNALVLTNAHVAGTQRGRVINVERWNENGTSEKSTGQIISAGYGRGMSVDFALLKCKPGFAKDVIPVPMANRFPDPKAMVTTYGCPRCEWPSLQVLKMNRSQGQILSWQPLAIGGRSGSSICDYTEAGPRVVGLLTWGGGGEGLGQSTPFLLNAMKGVLPKALEPLPPGVVEVANGFQYTVEAEPVSIMTWPTQEMSAEDESVEGLATPPDVIDQITEKPEEGRLIRPNPDRPTIIQRPEGGLFSGLRNLVWVALWFVAGLAVGYLYRSFTK